MDLGGRGMGYGLVFRWPNRCWYGDWVAGLVVLVFGLSDWWWFGVWVVVVLGDWYLLGFFSFSSSSSSVLLVVSTLVGLWWLLPCWGVWWWWLPCWACVVVQWWL